MFYTLQRDPHIRFRSDWVQHIKEILQQQPCPPCHYKPCGYLEQAYREAHTKVVIFTANDLPDMKDIDELMELIRQRPPS